MDRDAAVDRVEELVDTVVDEELPVPVREVWVYGDVALGLDPVERLDVYLTKDILLRGDDADRAAEFEREYGVKGSGRRCARRGPTTTPSTSGRTTTATSRPSSVSPPTSSTTTNPSTSRCATRASRTTSPSDWRRARDGELRAGARPRGVCLWVEGQRSEDAFEKLRSGELVFPTLAGALEMLGMDETEAETAAAAVEERRERSEGMTVRGDVV